MKNRSNGPTGAGLRMPAEWEKHEATWICWPQNSADWPGKFAPIKWVFAEMVRKISEGEKVRIIAGSKKAETDAKAVLRKAHVDVTKTEFFVIPTDRNWTRDFGPIFVKTGKGERAIAKFRFNAWAKYDNWKLDDKVAGILAKRLKFPILPAVIGNKPFTLEGGAIDVNGAGTLITTEECLLDDKVQVRNPGFGKADVETALRESLGAVNVIWLNKGIAGDDTHGHVDDICRFVNRDTVVACVEKNRSDANHAPLMENIERLNDARLEDGSRIDVVQLPMPSPLYCDGMRLPASYANFYISNAFVIVPTFNDENDRTALGILSELFPDRKVVGIHAVDLVWGLGTLHCLTQQQPAVG
ncbi:MAG: agmatine deiminase family protein [Nitrospinae bacterium]|nr:agmatine deiminase family protein [Nitrospinota bacterium]MBF0635144.1 agmatine deiminase family protein [Nitrospinota bacterium]